MERRSIDVATYRYEQGLQYPYIVCSAAPIRHNHYRGRFPNDPSCGLACTGMETRIIQLLASSGSLRQSTSQRPLDVAESPVEFMHRACWSCRDVQRSLDGTLFRPWGTEVNIISAELYQVRDWTNATLYSIEGRHTKEESNLFGEYRLLPFQLAVQYNTTNLRAQEMLTTPLLL